MCYPICITQAAIECCKIINGRINPWRSQMADGYTWQQLIEKCHMENIVLTESFT